MWGIGATDAHAKNYSLLLLGSRITLSPMYDVQSAAPYFSGELRNVPKGQVSIHKAELAMRIGAHRRFYEVTSDDWRTFAEVIGRDDRDILGLVTETVEAIPGALHRVEAAEAAARKLADAEAEFLKHFTIEVGKHANHMQNALVGRGPAPARKR